EADSISFLLCRSADFSLSGAGGQGEASDPSPVSALPNVFCIFKYSEMHLYILFVSENPERRICGDATAQRHLLV
uniref:Uncharacterized protein n=1 Tax=Oreochromis aureus TaxID=47969 RepID=A0AAZ1X9Z9_OREAU